MSKEKNTEIPLKIVPLGGLEDIGRNLIYLEYKDDILIIDVGLGFPSVETMPGIDFIIPDVSELEKKKEKIRGIIITHGHYDHIGAIPYLINSLGNPPIYATPLTKGLILKRQQEFPNAPKLQIFEINKQKPKKIKLGQFIIEYFHVNHNIPDSIGLSIQTPVGKILHTGDFKIDFSPIFDKPADLGAIVRHSANGVNLLMIDSTNAPEQGRVISEKKIMENLENIFKEAQGRIIAATFASLIERIQQLIWLANKYQRKVVIDGHTMKINVEVAKKLNYLSATKGILIRPEESLKLNPRRVLIICTGAQAEDNSVLTRIANREHRFFKIIPGDSVIFSSSIIPGNERAVQELKDALAKQGAKIYHYQMMDIHASGHGFSEDIKMMINLVKPKFILPIHGYYYMLKAVADIAVEMGYHPDQVIIASNGQVIEMTKEKVYLTKQKVSAGLVYVDGLGVGDVGEIVIRDRQALAKDGMFVIVVTIDHQTGEIKTSPDIISRGFVYLRQSQELLKEVRQLIRKVVKENVQTLGDESVVINEDHLKNILKEEIGEFLYQKTLRRPLILPVIIVV